MAKYIIRLDDACPTMNHDNWDRMERLLDKYLVKPIVGIIPDNSDRDFAWEVDEKFWIKAFTWQEKGWTIAQHGLHHKLHFYETRKGYYQLSHSTNTEFAGIAIDEQVNMLKKGNALLKEHGLKPCCFFAPAHTYDKNTVKALENIEGIKFISDGYALRIFKKDDMFFVPSICDGPFEMLFGLYTYVFHPSVMRDTDFRRLEEFLERNYEKIISAEDINWEGVKSQGLIGWIIERGTYCVRAIRKKVHKFG